MLSTLTKIVLQNWDRYFPNVKRPVTLNYLGISGSVEGGTTTYLAFSRVTNRPFFAVKVHRDRGARSRIVNESEVLSKIAASSPLLNATVPRVIFSSEIMGKWAIVESVLNGSPMMAAMNEDGNPRTDVAIKNLRKVSNWLIRLHRETSILEDGVGERVVHEKSALLNEFAMVFGLSTDESGFLNNIRNDLKSIFNDRSYIQHGDFCRQNILTHDNRCDCELGVIDWTDSRLHGSPLNDLLFFITSYCLQVRRDAGIKGFLKIFERTFLDVNEYSLAIKDCIVCYCSELGISISQVRAFLGLFLVEQAMFEYHKLVRFSKQGGLPRFTLTLASSENRSYEDALKEQLWIYFFKSYVAGMKSFIM